MSRLVLVMPSLVLQMVGGGKGDPYPGGLWGWCGYRSTVLLSVVFLRAVRVLAGSVVGDALVVSACGSWSYVVNRALSLVRVMQVVSVTVWLVPFVRAVWLLCQGSVALVMVTVVRCWLVPVVALRW